MKDPAAAPPDPGSEGFSLVELLAVLVLAGLLAALVAPSLSRTLESARLRAGAADVRTAMARARMLATADARGRVVAFDLDRGEYAIGGEARRLVLPEGVRFAAARVGARAGSEGRVRIRFFPDGSADDAEIALSSSAGGTVRVAVDPLTGLAEAVP